MNSAGIICTLIFISGLTIIKALDNCAGCRSFCEDDGFPYESCDKDSGDCQCGMKPDACRLDDCTTFCKGDGFPGGHCNETQCLCNYKKLNRRNTTKTVLDNCPGCRNFCEGDGFPFESCDEDSGLCQCGMKANVCKIGRCNKLCTDDGFWGGYCNGTRCNCNYKRLNRHNPKRKKGSDKCGGCRSFCEDDGFPYLSCDKESGDCQCGVKATECKVDDCSNSCEGDGYPGGYCDGNICHCNYKKFKG